MGNCLVTKLKGVVDNDMLVHLGYEQLTIDDWENWNGAVMNDTSDETFTFKIKSNHEFTDATHQQHLGKEIVVTAQTRTVMRFNALDGETGPVVVELGPKNHVYKLEGQYPLNENSYGYTELRDISNTVNVAAENLATLFPKVYLFEPLNYAGGDILEIANWDSLEVIKGGNNFTGALEGLLVAKYNRPQSAQMKPGGRQFVAIGTSPALSPTFNGVNYPGRQLRATYSDTAPFITVRLDTPDGTILGTWDGTSWTYAE
jgi:hypothetical protein